MPQSLNRKLIHTFFSTKNRAPLLRDTAFRNEMHGYIADNWKTARVVRDLGTNNPEPPAPPTP